MYSHQCSASRKASAHAQVATREQLRTSVAETVGTRCRRWSVNCIQANRSCTIRVQNSIGVVKRERHGTHIQIPSPWVAANRRQPPRWLQRRRRPLCRCGRAAACSAVMHIIESTIRAATQPRTEHRSKRSETPTETKANQNEPPARPAASC